MPIIKDYRKTMKIKSLLAIAACALSLSMNAQSVAPKREFRGAWIQCVNGQFQGMTAQKMQSVLTAQLDALQKAGINAIIFQIRAEADALYQSSYEPWSRYFSSGDVAW